MTTGKTVPELTAETPPIVGTDELVVYRAPGPLKRTTASVLGSYVNTVIGTAFTRTLLATASNSAFLTALGQIASSFVNFLQSGADASSETVQTTLRRIIVCPEQFSGTDTQKVNAAFQSAGDVPGGQNVARIVRFSRFYDTTSTIDVPAYVSIEGIGMGRCGLRPTMSSGPALRANDTNNSSSFLCEWRDFAIDGVNATGSAFALELTTQKVTMMTRLAFTNFNTTSHAVKLLLGCQSVIFDQCWWYANRLHQRIGVPYVGTSYPTTITHRGCVYEDGLIAGAEAIIIEDSSSCMWDQKCVLQGNLQPTLFRVTSSANEQTSAEHQWNSCWIEGNGAGPTWSFEGNVAKPLTNCVIEGTAIHGTIPTALVYAINTDRLQTQNNYIPAGYTLLLSGGGNTRYNETSAALYRLNTATFADVDGTNHRIFAPDGDVTAYFGATENLFPNTTHRFSSIGVAADFAIINSTGVRSNGSFLLGANNVLDVDGSNHRLYAPDGDIIFYAGATENLHRNATHRFGNQALSVDYGIFSSVGLNLGSGLALQIGGTQVVGAQGAAVANATGGAVVDTEARTALNALLSRLRAHGLIAT